MGTALRVAAGASHPDPILAAALAGLVSPSSQVPANVLVPMPHRTTLSQSVTGGLLLKEFNAINAYVM